MPPEIQRITNQFLHAPLRVEVSPHSSTVPTVEQKLVRVPHDPKLKREALRQLLSSQTNVKNAIVFANRKTTVGVLEASLKRHGFNAAALHGDMDQRARLRTLDSFRAGEITFLIASDVAARGLDIPEVSHVFNYDVPIHAEDYVHRIGRTGRAGREGFAFTLTTNTEAKYVKAIEQLIRKTIDWEGSPAPAEEAKHGGDKERRKSEPRRRPGKSGGERRQPAAVKSREETPRPVPQQQRQKEPPRGRRHAIADVPDSDSFHSGNMPAFLSRPVRSASS
jgi:superfamily II DNA/RNA helicase